MTARWCDAVQSSTLYRRAQAVPDFRGAQAERRRLWLEHNDYVEQMIAALGPKLRPADRVLAVGAGSGSLVLPVASRVRLCSVVEPSPVLCRRLLDDALTAGGARLAIIPGALQDLHEGFGFVETSLAAHAFEYEPDPAPLLVKLFRCTRRHILLVAGSGDPHPLQQEIWRRFRGADYPAPPGREELHRLLREEVGFRPITETVTTTDTLVYRDLEDAVAQWTEELALDGAPPDQRALRRLLEVWLTPLPGPDGGPPALGVRSMTPRALITCYPGE